MGILNPLKNKLLHKATTCAKSALEKPFYSPKDLMPEVRT